VVLFTIFWLAMWSFFERTIGIRALQGHASFFEYGWLGLWTIGGASAAFTVVWMLLGREKIVADAAFLSVRHEVVSLGWSRRFASQEVRNLRHSPPVWSRNRLLPAGVIAFDYGSRTYRFAGGVDEAEANQLIPRINHALGKSPDQRLERPTISG
jgi:hypothetical protein